MRNKITTLLLCVIVLISCNKKEHTKEVNLSIKINGLKKGKLILLKENSSHSFTKIDSLVVNGGQEINTSIPLDSPEMLFLVIDRNVSYSLDNLLPFFAEPQTMSIETNLELFSNDAVVKGSKNHDAYMEYKKVIKKFSDDEISLTQALFTNSITKEGYEDFLNRLQIKKYIYTLNFAFNNRDLEVAPYIALETFDFENPKMADSLYNVLSTNARNSIYGKELYKLVKKKKD